ncbi:hypothetical protein UF75_1797 [Desulfosporosinus sp. I2]|nr:hypothetical protein UF75_1797 [Desulfosporosinus sp. I2]
MKLIAWPTRKAKSYRTKKEKGSLNEIILGQLFSFFVLTFLTINLALLYISI